MQVENGVKTASGNFHLYKILSILELQYYRSIFCEVVFIYNTIEQNMESIFEIAINTPKI